MGEGGTPSSLGRGVSHPVLDGGVSNPVLDGGGGEGYPIQSWIWEYPGSPVQTPDGVPHCPDLGCGTPIPTRDRVPPSRPGMGYPLVQTWDGVAPTWDGVPPIQTWDGVPPCPDLGWGTPLSTIGMGYPLPGIGYPPPQM